MKLRAYNHCQSPSLTTINNALGFVEFIDIVNITGLLAIEKIGSNNKITSKQCMPNR